MKPWDRWRNDVKDPEINVQKELDNPHESESELGEVDVDKLVAEYKTSDFEQAGLNRSEIFWHAKRVSQALEELYKDVGDYVLAEISGSGVVPVVKFNEDGLWINEEYDPDVLEGEFSPLDLIDRTQYGREMMRHYVNTQDHLTDMSSGEVPEVEENFLIDYEGLAEESVVLYVAPGLQGYYDDLTRDAIIQEDV